MKPEAIPVESYTKNKIILLTIDYCIEFFEEKKIR